MVLIVIIFPNSYDTAIDTYFERRDIRDKNSFSYLFNYRVDVVRQG